MLKGANDDDIPLDPAEEGSATASCPLFDQIEDRFLDNDVTIPHTLERIFIEKVNNNDTEAISRLIGLFCQLLHYVL